MEPVFNRHEVIHVVIEHEHLTLIVVDDSELSITLTVLLDVDERPPSLECNILVVEVDFWFRSRMGGFV